MLSNQKMAIKTRSIEMVKWKESEIQYLIEHHLFMTDKQMARDLNRSVLSVGGKLCRMNLIRPMQIKKKHRAEGCKNSNKHKLENNGNWKGGISKNHYHYKKIQMERYPERVKARQEVFNAIQRGEIIRQACVVCGAEKAHAHHEDYSKPLDVIWLCRKHHREVHNGKH